MVQRVAGCYINALMKAATAIEKIKHNKQPRILPFSEKTVPSRNNISLDYW